MHLTELLIKKLKPQSGKQYVVTDDSVPGFGVRVSQAGRKAFVVRKGRKGAYRTIGIFPELSLRDARLQATDIKYGAEAKIEAKETSPIAPVSETIDRFLADASLRNKERTVYDYRRSLLRHFNWSKDIAEVSRSDIMKVIDRLIDTPAEQKNAFVAIRTMMNWSVSRGLIEHSPVPRIKFRNSSRNRVLSDEELKSVWFRAMETTYPFGTIIQLLVLTGQRRSEIGDLRWDWIKGDAIVFPAEYTKNKREHILPLPHRASLILKSIDRKGDLVFPQEKNLSKPFTTWGGAKRQFDQALEIGPYVLHDLRRTFSSNLARLGVRIEVTEKLLNHISGTVSGVAAVYNRYSYADEMREAIELHETFIRNLASRTAEAGKHTAVDVTPGSHPARTGIRLSFGP